MQDGKYIKLYRSFFDWEWYRNEHTKNLFIHCLLKANWKEGKFEGNVISRGSFVSSIGTLADETGLTCDEVRTAIKHLINTGEITKQSTNKYTVFTVVNYDLYQTTSQAEPKQDPSYSQTIPNNRRKERKEEEKNNINTLCKADADALLEKLWKLYPCKKGKGQVSDAAKMRLLKIGYDEMVRAIDRYKAELEKDSDWRKPQNGSTFFNSGYVDYLDANYEPSKKKTGSKNGFNNFKQNDYDFEQLERELISNESVHDCNSGSI
ncbi:MAG: hypothetical protein J6B68_01725 [Lachnospiraceae bacterium]|nr:hypothetical protein [Lachnospiraceae bacterium]MBP3477566.1 hypothetical protein [Lachnospiraceae bacterium]